MSNLGLRSGQPIKSIGINENANGYVNLSNANSNLYLDLLGYATNFNNGLNLSFIYSSLDRSSSSSGFGNGVRLNYLSIVKAGSSFELIDSYGSSYIFVLRSDGSYYNSILNSKIEKQETGTVILTDENNNNYTYKGSSFASGTNLYLTKIVDKNEHKTEISYSSNLISQIIKYNKSNSMIQKATFTYSSSKCTSISIYKATSIIETIYLEYYTSGNFNGYLKNLKTKVNSTDTLYKRNILLEYTYTNNTSYSVMVSDGNSNLGTTFKIEDNIVTEVIDQLNQKIRIDNNDEFIIVYDKCDYSKEYHLDSNNNLEAIIDEYENLFITSYSENCKLEMMSKKLSLNPLTNGTLITKTSYELIGSGTYSLRQDSSIPFKVSNKQAIVLENTSNGSCYYDIYDLESQGIVGSNYSAVLLISQTSSSSNSGGVKASIEVLNNTAIVTKSEEKIINTYSSCPEYHYALLNVKTNEKHNKLRIKIEILDGSCTYKAYILLYNKLLGSNYYYNSNNKLIKVTNDYSDITYVYDSNNNLVNNNNLSISYDEDNKIIRSEAKNGNKTIVTYDENNNVIKEESTSLNETYNKTTEYCYTNDLLDIVTQDNIIISDYFKTNGLITDRYIYDNDDIIKKVKYEYKSGSEYLPDNLKKIKYLDSNNLEVGNILYNYNSSGDLSNLEVSSTVYEISYDDLSRISEIKIGSNLINKYEYDEEYPSLVSLKQYGTSGDKYYFEYDAFHRLTKVMLNNTSNILYTYYYDSDSPNIRKVYLNQEHKYIDYEYLLEGDTLKEISYRGDNVKAGLGYKEGYEQIVSESLETSEKTTINEYSFPNNKETFSEFMNSLSVDKRGIYTTNFTEKFLGTTNLTSEIASSYLGKSVLASSSSSLNYFTGTYGFKKTNNLRYYRVKNSEMALCYSLSGIISSASKRSYGVFFNALMGSEFQTIMMLKSSLGFVLSIVLLDSSDPNYPGGVALAEGGIFKAYSAKNFKNNSWHLLVVNCDSENDTINVYIDNQLIFSNIEITNSYAYPTIDFGQVGATGNYDIAGVFVTEDFLLESNKIKELYERGSRAINYSVSVDCASSYSSTTINYDTIEYDHIALHNSLISNNELSPCIFIKKDSYDDFIYNELVNRNVYEIRGQTLGYNFNLSENGSVYLKFLTNSFSNIKNLVTLKDNNNTISVSINSNRQVVFKLNSSSFTSTKILGFSIWHSLCLTWEKSSEKKYKINVYIDGEKYIGELTYSLNNALSNLITYIGLDTIDETFIEDIVYSSEIFTSLDIQTLDNKFRERVVSYTKYNTLSLPTESHIKNSDNEIGKNLYDYNNKGILTRERIYANNYLIKTIDYEYDALLENITKYGDSEYTYDSLNRLTSETKNGVTTTYTYDVIGNILSKTKSGVVKTYTYDSLKRLQNYDNYVITYSSDNIYNPISIIKDEEEIYLEWVGKRLVSYTKGNNKYCYKYNDKGLRIRKEVYNSNVLSKTIKYYYDCNDRLVYEINGDNKLRYYYDEKGLLIGFSYNNTNYYYARSALGEIVGIINDEGSKVVGYSYSAYGEIESISGSLSSTIGVINPFRYKGYYYDNETGWFWLSSRYYSPELCRFISPDSVDYLEPESINGLNLYAYAKNNPIMYYDPSGHSAILVIGLLVGSFIVGAGASVVSQGLTYGWDEINYWQAGVDGLFALGSTALAMTGIGALASAGIGAVAGWSQYAIGSAFHGEDLTLLGSLTAIGLGAIGGAISGAGARNSANIASSMKLTGKGASAVKAITTASNRYLAGEISMKGLQATTRLWGNVALNAVQDAIAPTIRSLMIKGTIAITGWTVATVGINYGLSYLY